MMLLFWFAVLLIFSILEADGFIPLKVTPRYSENLYGVIDDDEINKDISDSGDDGNPSFDVENARQRLENLLSNAGTGEDENGNNKDNSIGPPADPFSFSKLLSDYDNGVEFSLASLPPPPPLSAIERSRRLIEIKLLECLLEGDDAISELWNHWYSERGSVAKLQLEETGGMFLDRSKWKECETNLIQLVDEFGIYFVEPVNLLATLFFIQKKYDLSYKLCEMILSIKPHHVGALSGIVEVAVCRRDAEAVRYWAAKRLPKLAPTPVSGSDDAFADDMEEEKLLEYPRRVAWVERAVATAKEKLDQAEQRTQENFFGKAEIYYDNSVGDNIDDENDGEAWQ
mmetsp:Transcript_19865/g.43136  ORF Transcript_19865/g.43136 Transcript_19865/m.43136 type:complete len:342 (+) Transcript_19865:221-1246(+)